MSEHGVKKGTRDEPDKRPPVPARADKQLWCCRPDGDARGKWGETSLSSRVNYFSVPKKLLREER